MKKRIGLFFTFFLGLFAIGGACVGVSCANHNANAIVAYAEGEDEAPVEEVFECSVVINEVEHGKITIDKEKGHVGDIVNVTIKHDLFYLAEYVAVNGTNLVEDEEVSGLYHFALVEGENKIDAKFIVDTEMLGEMSVIYEQARNKDWTNLFTVENVLRVVTFVLNGGLLFAMVRYFIKDKRIAKNVESSVKESVEKIIPEATKEVVVNCVKEVITPMFSGITGYQEEIIRVSGVLVKCVALMQQDTPESKQAVLNELANLNIGDKNVIQEAKNAIDKYFADKMDELTDVLSSLDNVIDKNKAVVEKATQVIENKPTEEEKKEEEHKYDGSEI